MKFVVPLAVLLIAAAAWMLLDGPPQADDLHLSQPAETQETGQGLLVGSQASQTDSPIAAPDVPDQRPWWFQYKVRFMPSAQGAVTFEVHWRKNRREVRSAHTTQIIRGSTLTAGPGVHEVRIEGETGSGYAQEFARWPDGRVESLQPFIAFPETSVTPGQGLRPDRVAVLGTHLVRVRVTSPEETPVAGARLHIHDGNREHAHRRLETDRDGVCLFDGAQEDELRIFYRSGPYAEFASLTNHTIPIDNGTAALVLRRNPRVRVIATLANDPNAPPMALSALGLRSLDASTGRFRTMPLRGTDSFSVPPGQHELYPRARTMKWNRETPLITPKLALDEEITLRMRAEPEVFAHPLIVSFDVSSMHPKSDVATTVDWTYLNKTYRLRDTVRARSITLGTSAQRITLRGAFRNGGEVWISETKTVTVTAGVNPDVVLTTSRAAGLRVTSLARPNTELTLTDVTKQRARVYVDRPFQFGILVDRNGAALHWMLPGTYTLSRTPIPNNGALHVQEITLKAGQTVDVLENLDGFVVK